VGAVVVLMLDVVKVHSAAIVAIVGAPGPVTALRVGQVVGFWGYVGVAKQHREVRYRAVR
jgi:hypothetical protein